MPTKAPSAGQKVTTGENIPTTREAPGTVPEASLAAESARKGGAFAANPGQQQQQQTSSQQTSSRSSGGTTHQEPGTAANKTTTLGLENQQTARGTSGKTGKTATETPSTTGSGGLESQSSYAGAAPSYVANQRFRDPAGPHGKNLKEGGFEGSGTEAGPLPEPGSAEDPTRVATRDLKAGMASQGRDAGERQTEGVQGKHWFTPLGGDEPA